ncbi:hypothetical protein ABAC460_08780 [Asticcacaulis sp. AC460]|uniref:hypothetical protein n=1 Tax=Asticcacaulis sp. AC460 TaxID=1282360 RepID=UPI0003C3D41E|nr:hypothetical protein [Asticcacaulis sp. AC460]ESQ90572.1 hypothetical protein ABAC460_08780 [Asticcacaulis sp. AC460]
MRLKLAGLAIAAGLLGSAPAHAGADTDKLSQCLVQSTSADDKKQLMLWVFSALALHPDIKAYSNITPQQRDTFDKNAAQLFMRLLTVDCRAQTVAAVKNDGQQALQVSFTVLGQVASQGLFTAPEVLQGMGGLNQNMDFQKLSEVFKEAGVQ